ncbi:MAG: protein-glutamate O-methyltransferase CheR [Ignavibacteria bacterium]|nr:protein-glutamate O-methyltransferase CheR [Ignavibacteria bacterium]
MQISDTHFQQISSVLYERTGIKLSSEKRIMIQGRLMPRVRQLSLTSFDEYFALLFSESNNGAELVHAIDVLTTNKTFFFREPYHFATMTELALPELRKMGYGKQLPLAAWSAGCSSGEEAYTMAIQIEEFSVKDPVNYRIYATDISTKMLNKAKGGIYSQDEIPEVPQDILRRYFLRSKNRTTNQVRVIPELRAKISFGIYNLMDDVRPFPELVQIIFCRNVLIYFDKETQFKVLSRLVQQLCVGGYLFHGHSESVIGMDLPLERVETTVYRKVKV